MIGQGVGLKRCLQLNVGLCLIPPAIGLAFRRLHPDHRGLVRCIGADMKILIVEDAPLVQDFMSRVVTDLGCKCIVAANGKEGLEAYEKHLPNMIISDINMPEMSGLELLKLIRWRNKDIFFIIMTGVGCEETAVQALRLGANNYLRKPVSVVEISMLIEQYASIFRNRTQEDEIFSMIESRAVSYHFGTTVEFVPKIADQLVIETNGLLDPQTKMDVRLGMFELLTNAVEHGNLGITMQEKRDALERGKYGDFFRQRLAKPDLASRIVKVSFTFDHANGCEWVIEDQGAGFDPQSIPSPFEGDGAALNCRGIYLARLLFDSMDYLGNGNTVRIRKKAKQSTPSSKE